jgi:hypothetical protein
MGLVGPGRDDLPCAADMKMARFQFSFRTLMICVTLYCLVLGGYVGWQKKIVIERAMMRLRLEEKGASFIDFFAVQHPEKSPGWLRRQLGDGDAPFIYRPAGFEISDDEILAMFPEADVQERIPVVL